MRLNCGLLSLAGVVIVLAIRAVSVDASFRPTFDLDDCSWNATHILLVQTTAQDGVFSVVESWKGDLKPGDSVDVPELNPDEHAVPISAYSIKEESAFQDKEGITGRIPRQPIRSQMILFLKWREESSTASPSAAVGTGMRWEPASAWGGIKVSVLWIDGGDAFCFRQWNNPGPSMLGRCPWWQADSSDVAVFTARIREVLQVQRHLAETLALKSADLRAARLGRIALGDVYRAQKEAMNALGKAGIIALPEILQIMDKPPAFYDGDELIRVFVEAAGKDSGKQLHARLRQDLIYWKAIGPTLTEDWSDQLMEPGLPLFVKFNETALLIHELDKERYAPAAQTAAELRDFWVSQPRLYDPKWGERDLRPGGTALEFLRAESIELADACDAFVRHVRAEKARQ